jgi:hypothetical protein
MREIFYVAEHEGEEISARFPTLGEHSRLADPWLDRIAIQIVLAAERETPGLQKASINIRPISYYPHFFDLEAHSRQHLFWAGMAN